MIMSGAELAKVFCETFDSEKTPMTSPDFYEVVATVVYYTSALHAVKQKPFRPDAVQAEVVAHLELKLDEAMQKMVERPLKIIRSKIMINGEEDC